MRIIVRLRPSPALIIACIALFVSLAGVGVAAVALVPRNSVGSDQVVDGSLRSRDFRSGQVVAAGDVLSRSVAGPVNGTIGRLTTVASLDIAKAGAYVIWGRADLADAPQIGGHCVLVALGVPTPTAGATPDAQQNESYVDSTVANNDTETLAPALVHGFASIGGSVELQCGSTSKRTPGSFRNVAITAIRLAGSG